MPVEGRGDNRGAPDARPRPHAGEHPAEDQRLELHGVPEGEELASHVRPARQPEVQVRQQEVLGGGLLRVHRRAQRGHDREVHPRAGAGRHRAGQAERQGVRGPVQQVGRHRRFHRHATSQGAIGPERK